jgi:glycosyltransferase 2 family protein
MPLTKTPDVRRPKWRRWAIGIGEGAAVVAACAALYGVIRVSGPTLRRAHAHLQWGVLLAASGVWLLSYAQLVQLWSSSLPWWNASLRTEPRPLTWFQAMRVFFVSNLARYVPGAVWQFAGLAAMSAEVGASPVAASVAVLLQQVVLLATGFVLLLSGAPHLLGAWARTLDTASQVVLAVALTGVLVGVGPRALPIVRRWAERVIKRPVPLPAPPPRAFALYVVRAALGWVGYGLAFWIFGRALFGDAAPDLWLAGTAYLSSYLLGLIAVFAPGGIVVREGALIVQLSAAIGTDRAVVLAIASRLWLVSIEIVAAVAVLAIDWVARRVKASAARR